MIRSRRTEKRVACIGEVGFHSLLIEFGDLMAARAEPLDGPLARLVAYDEKHKTNLVDTLAAWLDSFGDAAAASKTTFVHPNTFRYRLRRLAEQASAWAKSQAVLMPWAWRCSVMRRSMPQAEIALPPSLKKSSRPKLLRSWSSSLNMKFTMRSRLRPETPVHAPGFSDTPYPAGAWSAAGSSD